MAGRRRARAGISLVALLVGALWVLVPALPAFAATSLTVTPHTGLSDGTTVTVVTTGWNPGELVGVCQAVPVLPVNVLDCDGGGGVTYSADGSGNVNITWQIRRLINPAVSNGLVDCTDPTTPCVLAVAAVFDVAGTAISVPLGFTPPPPPTIVPTNSSVLEGNSGTSSVDLPVVVHNANLQTVTVDWRTVFVPGAAGDQADPATDYIPASGTLTIPPRDFGDATIDVKGDNLVEPDEYILVQLSNPTNAGIGVPYGLGSVTIRNDDHARVVPGAASVLEGNAGTTDLSVPVTLSNPSTQTVTAQWRTVNAPGAPGDQADPASDYSPASGTVTFAPGQTAQTVTISVNGDATVEPNEYVIVQFGNATNATIGGFYGLGFGVITNDD